MKTLLLIFTLSTSALACGSVQSLYGLIHDNGIPISNAVVQVSVDRDLVAEVQTGPFGLYSTTVGPCPELHTISVSHRRYSFAAVQFWTDGSGDAINVNISTEQTP
jgi:hypothetical protein